MSAPAEPRAQQTQLLINIQYAVFEVGGFGLATIASLAWKEVPYLPLVIALPGMFEPPPI